MTEGVWITAWAAVLNLLPWLNLQYFLLIWGQHNRCKHKIDISKRPGSQPSWQYLLSHSLHHPPLLSIWKLHTQHFISDHNAVIQIHVHPSMGADQETEFSSRMEDTFCFILCTHLKRAWGERHCCLLQLISLPDTDVSGTRRGERIFDLTLSLPAETSGRLWYTWWSATLNMITTTLINYLKTQE